MAVVLHCMQFVVGCDSSKQSDQTLDCAIDLADAERQRMITDIEDTVVRSREARDFAASHTAELALGMPIELRCEDPVGRGSISGITRLSTLSVSASTVARSVQTASSELLQVALFGGRSRDSCSAVPRQQPEVQRDDSDVQRQRSCSMEDRDS